jgi:hypothetical protein
VLTDVPSGCAYLNLNNNQTITSNYSVSGNSTIQRLHVVSSVVGSTRTLTIPATRTSNNVDYRDITISGTALSGTSLGNMLGNTNITFTAAVTRYARNSLTNFSSTTSWATTSGGAAGASVPLPQDNIIFDNNSNFLGGDMPNLGNNITVDSSYGNSYLFSTGLGAANYDVNYYLFGTYTFNTPFTCHLLADATREARLFLCNRTTRTLNTTLFTTDTMISAPGATVTLAGNTTFQQTYGTPKYCDFGVVAGTLNTNNYTINARAITVKPAYINTEGLLFGYANIQGLDATYNFGSSTINLYREEYSKPKEALISEGYIYFGYEFDPQYSFNITVNAGTSNIYLWNNVDQGDQARLTTSNIIPIFNSTLSNVYLTEPTFYNFWLASTLSSGTCAYRWTYLSNLNIASINTLGIHTSYAPTTLTVNRNAGIVCNNIDTTNAGPNNGLIICNAFISANQTSSALNRTTLTCNNNITTNYVSYRNIDCDSGQITAYGVANLGNNTGNFLWSSAVAVAAFTTTGNYTVSMPTNFSGSAVAEGDVYSDKDLVFFISSIICGFSCKYNLNIDFLKVSSISLFCKKFNSSRGEFKE